MKNIKYLAAFMIMVALSFTSCESFEEINMNPNNPEIVPLTTLLGSGIIRSIDQINGASMNMTYAGLWGQHYAKIQYIDEDYYLYRADVMDIQWGGLYAGPLEDIQDMLDNPDIEPNMRAAAMVIRAYMFSVITDCWGDVPYSQSLSVTEFVQPVFDEQSAIYADLVSQLEMASAMFTDGGDDLGSGDFIYGGDIGKWRKFANSLLARLLNRMKGVDGSAQAKLTALFSNPANVFESNDDNAVLVYPGDATWSNPLYENKYSSGRNDHAISKTLTDVLNGWDDPRLPVYAAPNIDGDYEGQPNGTSQPAVLTAVSPIGTAFRDDPSSPVYFITYSEVMFIKAEAMGDKTAYLEGITASMERNGVTADATYMTAAGDAYDAAPLENVITQKWADLFGNGIEAWTEFRRTGFPSSIVEVPNSVYPGEGVPHRYAYPNIESSVNETNLSSAMSRQNVTGALPLHGNKMWWVP